MEIAPGIHRIKCTFGDRRMVYVHLLIGPTASMLIDTGCAHSPHQDILPYMERIGFDPATLTYVLITHSDLDHQGGNQAIQTAAPAVLFLCHRLDQPWVDDTEALIAGRYAQFEQDHGIGYGEAGKASIRADCLSVPVDMTLSGSEAFRLGPEWTVRAVHTPGHTWGHTAVYDPRSRTLISGEASMGTAILDDNWAPAMPPTYCYVDTYLATQDHLLALPVTTLAPAHWPVQHGADVASFIAMSKAYCLQVEQALLDFATAQPDFTLRQAIETLGPTLGNWPAGANQDFSYGMLGNLESLSKRGLLQNGRSPDGLVTWRCA